MATKTSQETIDKMQAMYDSGLSLAHISRELRLDHMTVSHHVKGRRLVTERRAITPEQIEEANVLYQQGISTEEISRRFGLKSYQVNPHIRNKMTRRERADRFPAMPKVHKEMTVAEYMDAIGPDYDRHTMTMRIQKKLKSTYAEAETYYEAWRAEYMKRRVI